MAKTKKINPKEIGKNKVMEILKECLTQNDISFENGEEFGFTKGTLVLHLEEFDMQLKPITPKTGVERYEKFKDEE